MLASTYFGKRVGIHRKIYAASADQHSVVIGSLLALQGLLLAFTFAMAGSRFEARRQAIVEEAAAIRSALLLTDGFEAAERNAIRKDIKNYLEVRINYFEAGVDQERILATKTQSRRLVQRMWRRAVSIPVQSQSHQLASEQMLTALLELLKAQEARHAAVRARVPDPIVYMLFILSIATAFFAGYAGSR